MTLRCPTVLVVLVACSRSVCADDLNTLAREYRQAATSVRGAAKDRAEAARKHVTPILAKIGKLGTEEALRFLLGELDGAIPEIAAACAAPILDHADGRAPSLVLKGFSRRAPAVQVAILEAVAESKRDLKGAQEDLVAIAGTRLPAAVKKALPGALATIDTPASAKALVAQVRDVRGGSRGGEEETAYARAVVSTLKKTKSDEVKGWLARDGFKVAGSSPARLRVLVEVVGALRLSDARDQLKKLVGHSSGDLAATAVDALARLGIGDAAEDIASALERRRGKGEASFTIRALDALALSGSPSAVEVVLRFARSRDAQSRAIAMGSLALAAKNREALAALLEGLNDSDPSVRNVALKAIGRVREKAVIGPLVDALASQKDPSYRVKVLELLVNMTGENFGLAVVDWKKWWEVAEASFEFPEASADGFTKVKRYDLDYFGIEVSSKRLGFIVDISSSMTQMVPVKVGSMEDDEDEESSGRTVARRPPKPGGGGKVKDGKARKIDVLKHELVRVLKKLPSDAFVNILLFDATFREWQKQLQPLAGTGRAKAVSFVEGINTGRGTNVFDSLEHALQDKRVDTVYLLSDGLPTRGRITDPAAILREIGMQNRLRGVTIHCIAFGEESSLLKDLAAQNGGQYRFVDRY